MKVSLPQPGPWRRLSVAVVVSLLIHVCLFALGFLLKEFGPHVIVKKGEPLFVELPKPEEEPAPRGNPALPLGPPAASRPPAPKPPPPAKPAPKIETARPAPKAESAPSQPAPAPAPPQVAKAAPLPEPEGTMPAPVPPKEEAKREPPAPAAAEPKTALAKPRIDLPPSLQGGTGGERPGGGGGLRAGRGGMEGEPVPLDTTDPRYTDYFEKVRRQIKEKWIYPREAGERGIGGQLLIEFGIRKEDGMLQFVELRRSSGVPVLDEAALIAVKLAQPYPPVPDSVSKGTLGIAGIFNYVIVDSGLLNQYLR